MASSSPRRKKSPRTATLSLDKFGPVSHLRHLAISAGMSKNTLPPCCSPIPDMEKIVISGREIADTGLPPDESARVEAKLAPAAPWWAKLALSPLVLFLPLLCLVSVVLRVAMRGLTPRTRFAWASLMATLLTISGVITSVAAVLILTLHPLPTLVGGGLSDLDERRDFPALPVTAPMSARQVSETLKPLVQLSSVN